MADTGRVLGILEIGIGGQKAVRTLNVFSASANNAGRATEHFERTTKNLTRSLGALGGYFGIRQLVEYADTWTLIRSRVDLVTSSTEQSMAVQQKLYEIAVNTRNSLSATSVLYTRVALNADQLGRSHKELLGVVSAVNSAMLISGATGVEAAQSMRQFAQALGSGRVQGDEFRTMMEAMPVVARAVADQMGVAMGDLYKLSKKGKIDVQTVIDALLAKQKELEDKAKNMRWTVGQAFEVFTIKLTRTIGILSMGYGATAALAKGLNFLGDHIDVIVSGLAGATAAFIAFKAAMLATAITIGLIDTYYKKAAISQAIMTGIDTIRTIALWAREIRRAADAAALLQLVLESGAKAMATVAGLVAGVGVYIWMQKSMEKATAAYEKADEKLLKEKLGTLRERLDEEAQRQRERNEDLVREAMQERLLAKMTGDAQKKMALEFEAANKAIKARRELSGQMLEDTLASIRMWLRLKKEQVDIEAQVKKVTDAVAEQERIMKQYAKDIQRAFADTFYEIFENGIGRFEDLFKAIKSMFLRMVAEMLSAKMMSGVATRISSALAAVMNTGPESIPKYRANISAVEVENAMGGRRGLLGPVPVILDPVSTGKLAETWQKKLITILGPVMAGYGAGGMIGGMAGNQFQAVVGGGAAGGAAGYLIGGPLGAAFGGLMGAIGGLSAISKRHLEELQHNREVLEKNNEKLTQLRESFEGQTVGSRYGEAMAFMRERGGMAVPSGWSAQQWMDSLNRLTQTYPLLVRLAKELGIDTTGDKAWEQLYEALQLAARNITQFGNNLQDLTTKQEAYNKIFDIPESKTRALTDSYEILARMAPDLMKQLGLSNLDMASPLARKTIVEGLKDIFNMIVSGELTPELLGSFTDKNQLLDAILKVKDSLNEFDNALQKVTTDFPRAMDIAYYEQKYGTFGFGHGSNANTYVSPVPTTPAFVIQGDVQIVNEAGDDGEVLLVKLEDAVENRVRGGGHVYLGQENNF